MICTDRRIVIVARVTHRHRHLLALVFRLAAWACQAEVLPVVQSAAEAPAIRQDDVTGLPVQFAVRLVADVPAVVAVRLG